MNNGCMTLWLEAYHDGVLDEARRRRVAAHLVACATCRTELAQLEALRALLHRPALPLPSTPAAQFVAQVGLRLPRRDVRARRKRGWAIPAALLGAWTVTQMIWALGVALLLAIQLGAGEWLGLAWLTPFELSTPGSFPDWVSGGWLTLLTFAGSLRAWCSWLWWLVVIPLEVLAGVVVLYWGWLAAWWLLTGDRRRMTEFAVQSR